MSYADDQGMVIHASMVMATVLNLHDEADGEFLDQIPFVYGETINL